MGATRGAIKPAAVFRRLRIHYRANAGGAVHRPALGIQIRIGPYPITSGMSVKTALQFQSR